MLTAKRAFFRGQETADDDFSAAIKPMRRGRCFVCCSVWFGGEVEVLRVVWIWSSGKVFYIQKISTNKCKLNGRADKAPTVPV